MKNKSLKIILLIVLFGMIAKGSYSQIQNLNTSEKMLVKKWQVVRTYFETEMKFFTAEEAYTFTFSADNKWKKESSNPKYSYHGTWTVDTVKQIVFITWEEKFDTNTYQYKIKTLTDQELIIEPLNAYTETVYYKVKE